MFVLLEALTEDFLTIMVKTLEGCSGRKVTISKSGDEALLTYILEIFVANVFNMKFLSNL